jgi:hypothetical protein
MPIHSGSHELYEELSLRRRAADVLAEWARGANWNDNLGVRNAAHPRRQLERVKRSAPEFPTELSLAYQCLRRRG